MMLYNSDEYYIDFLESINADPMLISKIQLYLQKFSDEYASNMEKNVKKIFSILSYAGLTTEQIEQFIYNNVRFLEKSENELFKLGAVFNAVGANDELFSVKSYIIRMGDYKRLYARDLLFKKAGYANVAPTLLLSSALDIDRKSRLLEIAIKSVFGVDANEVDDNSLYTYFDKKYGIKDYIDNEIDKKSKILARLYRRDYLMELVRLGKQDAKNSSRKSI